MDIVNAPTDRQLAAMIEREKRLIANLEAERLRRQITRTQASGSFPPGTHPGATPQF